MGVPAERRRANSMLRILSFSAGTAQVLVGLPVHRVQSECHYGIRSKITYHMWLKFHDGTLIGPSGQSSAWDFGFRSRFLDYAFGNT